MRYCCSGYVSGVILFKRTQDTALKVGVPMVLVSLDTAEKVQ